MEEILRGIKSVRNQKPTEGWDHMYIVPNINEFADWFSLIVSHLALEKPA
jgi:hypothetical protein